MGTTAAVLGASGYAGGELVRLLDAHPGFDLAVVGAHGNAGRRLAEVHPHLANGDRVLAPIAPEAVTDVDVVFLALPHGASAPFVASLGTDGPTPAIVDLGADFRLDTAARYRTAYEADHPDPDALADWPYGLAELHDVDDLARAIRAHRRVAVPGCYPTATLLAIVPLLRAGLVEGPLVVDALSGASGAGRSADPALGFGAVDEGVRAYRVGRHRHRPEIEMGVELATGAQTRVTFTPHLVPMQRGLLATVTAPLADPAAPPSNEDVQAVLADAYAGRRFVEVLDRPPQTRWVVGSNRALLHAVVDRHAGVVIAQAAIDNLVKGAAGQAIQCANLLLGDDETVGLPLDGWMP